MTSHTGGHDAQTCRAIVGQHARTFALASRLLAPDKRRGAYAVYATCRTADDIVDVGPEGDAPGRLARFRRDALTALSVPSEQPVLRELAWAVARFGIPIPALEELFSGVERDLVHAPFGSWKELEGYCEGVAGSVGEMVCAVFGTRPEAEPARIVRHARTLGVAMQLTNILRDVGEDSGRRRCYLPLDELDRHGLSHDLVRSGDLRNRWGPWREFMAFQVERARVLYRQAADGIRWLEPDARRCALACAAGYADILRAIERSDYDTLSGRVSASRRDRLRVMWGAFRLQVPAFGADPGPDGRAGRTMRRAAPPR